MYEQDKFIQLLNINQVYIPNITMNGVYDIEVVRIQKFSITQTNIKPNCIHVRDIHIYEKQKIWRPQFISK